MKKTISLLLAVTMLLSMMTMGVHAAQDDTLNACGVVGFKDLERITYTNAVAVTAGIGLFTGTDEGKFEPHGQVTRAQMATIVVKMLKGADFNADSYKGESNPFPDTADFQGGWAEGYINACVQLGIVKGYGDGKFFVGGFYWASREGEYGLVPNGYKYGLLDFSGSTPSGVLYVNSNKERVGDAARPINDLTAGTAEYGYAKIDSYSQFLTNCPLTNDEWDFFYVLRPAQAAYDIQDLTYDPNAPVTPETPAAN